MDLVLSTSHLILSILISFLFFFLNLSFGYYLYRNFVLCFVFTFLKWFVRYSLHSLMFDSVCLLPLDFNGNLTMYNILE